MGHIPQSVERILCLQFNAAVDEVLICEEHDRTPDDDSAEGSRIILLRLPRRHLRLWVYNHRVPLLRSTLLRVS